MKLNNQAHFIFTWLVQKWESPYALIKFGLIVDDRVVRQ